jgi:hypothetical protein
MLGFKVDEDILEESEDSEHNRRVEAIKLEDEIGHAGLDEDQPIETPNKVSHDSVMKMRNAKQDKHMIIIKQHKEEKIKK